MSLKKKIALSFIISASVIMILAAFESVSFFEIKREIRWLELTDTIRSKSLQLRRHEKNFFLYPERSREESTAIYEYLGDINVLLNGDLPADRTGKLAQFKALMGEYHERFRKIESSIIELARTLSYLRDSRAVRELYPLIELTFREQPLRTAEFLKKILPARGEQTLFDDLVRLDSEITQLRKNGEDITLYSKELDRVARRNVDNTIQRSQMAIVLFFSLFFVSGIATLFCISRSVARRINLLIDVMEKTGKGQFAQIPITRTNDEVGVLISKFNSMEQQLASRDAELKKKNDELLQSRKLAAIGTLASGVAHELNNPLNNVYLSAQVLKREAEHTCSPTARETVDDILSQTMRVKSIVGDLLEFARGREPQARKVDLRELVMGAYKLVSMTADTQAVTLSLVPERPGIEMYADPEQMERVFINLFSNAVDAVNGRGEITVNFLKRDKMVEVNVSDNGKGIAPVKLEKIFEPFYSTKDTGTGLGLAIVFNIIKRHGGDIGVRSKEGEGTTFTILLPVKTAPSPQPEETQSEGNPGTEERI